MSESVIVLREFVIVTNESRLIFFRENVLLLLRSVIFISKNRIILKECVIIMNKIVILLTECKTFGWTYNTYNKRIVI